MFIYIPELRKLANSLSKTQMQFKSSTVLIEYANGYFMFLSFLIGTITLPIELIGMFVI